MQMVKMVATEPMEYPIFTPRKKGEKFDCEGSHVIVLETLGRAKRDVEGAPQTYQTRVLTAAQQRKKVAATPAKKQAGRRAN